MKAKNSEKIIRGYLEFAGGLLISTALSMALLPGLSIRMEANIS